MGFVHIVLIKLYITKQAYLIQCNIGQWSSKSFCRPENKGAKNGKFKKADRCNDH